MSNLTRVDIIAELVAVAVGVDASNEVHMERFRAYLDLYADERFRSDECPPALSGQPKKKATKANNVKPSPEPVKGTSAPELLPKITAPVGRDAQQESEKINFSAFSGQRGTEKREIFDRLMRFREANGLGCLDIIAKASDGAVSADELRDMMSASSYPVAKWQAVASALDRIE